MFPLPHRTNNETQVQEVLAACGRSHSYRIKDAGSGPEGADSRIHSTLHGTISTKRTACTFTEEFQLLKSSISYMFLSSPRKTQLTMLSSLICDHGISLIQSESFQAPFTQHQGSVHFFQSRCASTGSSLTLSSHELPPLFPES